MLVTLGGQTVTCMLLLTSYFCFYYQGWRGSVVSTFWDSINPKVIFGTWYQIIKGIFCCSHTFLIRSKWSFPLFLWPHCVIQGLYCEEKLDVSHSWGSNGYLHVIAYLLFLFLLPKMKGVLLFPHFEIPYSRRSYSLRQKSLPSVLLEPFNSHEWSRQNFSLQYRYNIKHRSDENKVKYQ